MTSDIFDEICKTITENYIATQDEIDLVCSIICRDFKTFYDIIYVRTGFRSFEQLKTDGYFISDDRLLECDFLYK